MENGNDFQTYEAFYEQVKISTESDQVYQLISGFLEQKVNFLKEKYLGTTKVLMLKGNSDFAVSSVLRTLFLSANEQFLPIYLNTRWLYTLTASRKSFTLPISSLISSLYGIKLDGHTKKQISLILDGPEIHDHKILFAFIKEINKISNRPNIQFIINENGLYPITWTIKDILSIDLYSILDPTLFFGHIASNKIELEADNTDEIASERLPVYYLRNKLETSLEPSDATEISFVLNHLLPYIAFELFSKGIVAIEEVDLFIIIKKAAVYFYNIHYATAFPDLKNELAAIEPNQLFSNELKVLELKRRILVTQQCFVVEKVNVDIKSQKSTHKIYYFKERFFRDYFYCRHIHNALKVSLLANQDIPKVFKNRPFAKKEMLLLGTYLGEQNMKPSFSYLKGWHLPDAAGHTLLMQLLSFCKGVFNRKYTGWINWNIINTLIHTRGELTGLNLSNLDLYGINLHGIICSRKNGQNYLAANFQFSKLYKHNFTERVNFIPNRLSIRDNVLHLYDQRKKQIALINTQSGHLILNVIPNKFEGNYLIPLSEHKLLIIERKGKITCWNILDKFIEYELDSGLSNISTFYPDNKLREIFLIDRNGKLISFDVDQKKIKLSQNKKYLSINTITRNPFNKDLFIGYESGKIECVSSLNKSIYLGHTSKIVAFAFIKSLFIVSADEDGWVMLWKYNSGQCIKKLAHFKEGIAGVSYHNKHANIQILTCTGNIFYFSFNELECIAKVDLSNKIKTPIKVSSFEADTETLIIVNREGVYGFDTLTGDLRIINKFVSDKLPISINYHDSEPKVVLTYADSTIKEWLVNKNTIKCLNAFKIKDTSKNDLLLSGAIYQPESEKILVINKDKDIHFYKEGILLRKEALKKLEDKTKYLCKKRNDELFLISKKGTIFQFNLKTLEHIKNISTGKKIKMAALHPFEERLLLLINNYCVIEWNLTTNSHWHTYPQSDVKIIAINYDNSGERVQIITTDGKLMKYDVETENLVESEDWTSNIKPEIPFNFSKKIIVGNISELDIREFINQLGFKSVLLKNNMNQPQQLIAYEKQKSTGNTVTINRKNQLCLWQRGKERILQYAIDYPGVFICGCNIRNMNPTSEMLLKDNLQFLENQGALVFDPLNIADEQKLLN